MEGYPGGYHDSHIKRINASQMYQITQGDYMERYVKPYGDREKLVKQKWIDYFDLVQDNFAEEVSICTPR